MRFCLPAFRIRPMILSLSGSLPQLKRFIRLQEILERQAALIIFQAFRFLFFNQDQEIFQFKKLAFYHKKLAGRL